VLRFQEELTQEAIGDRLGSARCRFHGCCAKRSPGFECSLLNPPPQVSSLGTAADGAARSSALVTQVVSQPPL
jgi:hypothetical protein